LALGVERVVSFTDGDKAGREAAYIIEDSFSDLIDLRLIKMWRLTKKLGLKKLDPFECPKKHLRRYVAKHHLQ
jgi:DNA primase